MLPLAVLVCSAFLQPLPEKLCQMYLTATKDKASHNPLEEGFI